MRNVCCPDHRMFFFPTILLLPKTGTFQTVSPYQIPGTSRQRLKVIVQGKQSKPVVDYLVKRGIPKRWVEVIEMVKK